MKATTKSAVMDEYEEWNTLTDSVEFLNAECYLFLTLETGTTE